MLAVAPRRTGAFALDAHAAARPLPHPRIDAQGLAPAAADQRRDQLAAALHIRLLQRAGVSQQLPLGEHTWAQAGPQIFEGVEHGRILT